MKSRLLAALLSVSMLFGSLPVNAAELNAGIILESIETSDQEDEETNASEETTLTDDASEENENNSGEDNSADVPSVGGEASDGNTAQDDTASEDKNGDASDTNGGNTEDSDSSNTEDSDNSNTEDEDNSDTSDEENTADSDMVEDNSEEITEEVNTEAEENFVIASDEVIPLQLGENTLILPGYVSGSGYIYNWLSFEAPEAGYYNFHSINSGSYSYRISMYDDINGDYIADNYYSNMHSNYMKAGDTLYFLAYASSSSDATLELEVQKLTVYSSAVKQEDGSYSFDADDYTLSVLPRAGVTTVRVDAALENVSENMTDDLYLLLAFIREPVNIIDYNNSSSNLYRYSDYQTVFNIPAAKRKEYNLRFILMDVKNNVLGLFIPDTVLATQSSDEAVVIYDATATESSITMDLEAMQYGRCYYAPVDGSEDEQSISIDKGWKTYSFTSLHPETEYYFTFTNSDGKELFETTAYTAEASTHAVYSAELSEDGNYINIEADVSGYKGTATYAYLYYEYTNELGMYKSEGRYHSIEQNESEETSFTITNTIPIVNEALEAGKAYDITLWVKIGNNDLSLSKEIKSVTIPQAGFDADKLTFTISPSENNENAVNYAVEIADYTGDAAGKIYYKQHGSKDNYSSPSENIYLTESNNPVTGIINNIQSGIDYDFILFLDGIKKEVTTSVGTASVTLSQAADGTNETNAFDIVSTYEIKSEDGAEALTGEYTLKLYSLKNGYYSTGLAYDVTLSAENDYRAEVKTASRTKLTPNTDYDLKWELTDASGSVVDILYESITTSEANITFEPIESESNYSTQKFNVTLAESDRANFDDLGTLSLYSYIRKAGSNSYRNNYSSISLRSYNEYSNSISFTGLDEKTAYEISLRDSSGIEYASTSFTTPADERTITVTGVSPSLHRVTLNYSITGVTSSMNLYVACHIREKGADDDAWENADTRYWYGDSSSFNISKYNGVELKDGTPYEYKIGFASDYYSPLSSLEKIIEGEFSTKEDSRTLSNLSVSASYTTADISAFLSGNEAGQGSYIYYFYREKGAANWLSGNSSYTNQASYNYSQKLTGLTQDTTYEYVLVVSDNYTCSSPDEITKETRKVSTEFTTQKLDITLEFSADDSKITNSQAVISVTAFGTIEERLKLVLILSDGQKQSVTLKSSDGYKGEVTFTNLIGETEYTITGADISMLQGTGFVDLGVFEYDYKFTTRKAEIPTSITLSSDKIALNALYAGYTGTEYEGYSYQILEASAVPATAAADFIWRSTNENVATVSQNGKVTAKGAGSTVITAESVYDSTVKAQCEVVVKDYVIGHDIGTEIEKLDNINFYSYYSRYKNSYTEGIALYERTYDEADGTEKMTILSGFSVTAFNPQTASWEDGRLYANSVGYSSFIFEKDGIKARLNIYVTTEGKGFGITGVSTDFDDYPAVKQSDGSYLLAYKEGYEIDYWLDIEVSPYKYEAEPDDFNYSSSNTEIATVNEYGYITPRRSGDVEITVTPKNRYTINSSPYAAVEEAKVILHIKEVPVQGDKGIYALANVHKKIGDIHFPENWGSGWSWKYPDTPIVTNAVYTQNSYAFEAVYSGTDYYPCETTLLVYLGKITGVRVNDTTAATHNQVLETGGEDKLVLRISPISQGSISSNDYEVDIPAVNGLTISKNTDGSFDVTAQKKGSYTLKPVIKAKGANTVFASTSYKIKAVEEKQAAYIELTTDTEGVTITGNKIIFETVEAKKDFTLNAKVTDRNGESITTAIAWSTTDKTVATVVTASKTDTHSAKVTAKGDGHTVITATAKDAAGISTKMNLEIQDHSPRVDTAKVNVNIAYDYKSYEGISYAYNAGGAVEIVPVYNEDLAKYELRDKNGTTESQNLKIEQYYSGGQYKYLVSPVSDSLQKGTYNCDLYVKTSAGNEYTYPLKVSVIDKAPSVTAKMTDTINLFYKNYTGRITFKVSGGEGTVTNITWDKASNNGFIVNEYSISRGDGSSYTNVSQGSNLTVNNKKLADASVAKGTLSLQVTGYKKVYEFKNFSIKYNYKKPALTTKYTSNNIIPSLGQSKSRFRIYNKTDKSYFYYNPNSTSRSYYNEIKIDNSVDVKLDFDKSDYTWMYFDYTGNENSKKFSMTLDSIVWREPLKVTHTVKKIKPTAYLTIGQITFNTVAIKSASSTEIRLKNVDNADITSDIGVAGFFNNVVISGSNAKAQKLLDDDLITIETDVNDSRIIYVDQNEAAFMNSSIPAGTYGYKITPYYTNKETGASTALNTVTLKIKVINKPVTAKVSPKGNLDLTYGASSAVPAEKKNYAVLVDPKLSNLPNGYLIEHYSLTGEYSEYFNIDYGYIRYGNKYGSHYYITIKDNTGTRKLKASQAYKLAIEYTFTNYSGEKLKVKSNTFTIKTKQSAPKVTVTNNNQTLYAAADGVSRSYRVSVPSGYTISGASGGIDCNKDGINDIEVYLASNTNLTVRINDRDAVGATAKGKSYSIPVTVTLRGRDGIAKDVKVTIKVKVRR